MSLSYARKAGSALAVLVSILLLAGCAMHDFPDAPTEVERTVLEQYVIGPGDSLQVAVRGNPDLSSGVAVRPDGQITTPWSRTFRRAGAPPRNWRARWKRSWRATCATPSSPSW